MLTKELIIAQVNALSVLLNVTPDNFVITAGSAAVMHGLREVTEDVDIDVMPHMWEYLLRHYPTHPIQKTLCGEVMCFTPLVSIHLAKPDGGLPMELDGLEVLDLPSLRSQYLMLSEHPERSPAKVERDKETLVAIQLKIDNEWNTRPINFAKEASDALSGIVKQNLEMRRVSKYFKQSPNGMVHFMDDDGRVWIGNADFCGSDAPIIKLHRTVGLTARDMELLINPNSLSLALQTAEKDMTLQFLVK